MENGSLGAQGPRKSSIWRQVNAQRVPGYMGTREQGYMPTSVQTEPWVLQTREKGPEGFNPGGLGPKS